MIEKLIGKTGIALIAAALMVCAAGLLYLAAGKISGMVEDARKQGRAESDHYWRAEIEKSNAALQAQIAENLRKTMALQEAARDQVAEAQARAADLEQQNAALPDNGACGLSRDRVRLLNAR